MKRNLNTAVYVYLLLHYFTTNPLFGLNVIVKQNSLRLLRFTTDIEKQI